jgi:hypothetical protein
VWEVGFRSSIIDIHCASSSTSPRLNATLRHPPGGNALEAFGSRLPLDRFPGQLEGELEALDAGIARDVVLRSRQRGFETLQCTQEQMNP